MSQFVRLEPDHRARQDIETVGFTRRPLRMDRDVVAALNVLSASAGALPRDQYYSEGDRFRTFNRYLATIVEGGVQVALRPSNEPYVQLEKYNTTLGGQAREYQPLAPEIAGSTGVLKIIAHHLAYLPLSKPGVSYDVNMHIKRFSATPDRPCNTSPPGLHKDGEKYLATHLLSRCGASGGEVIITDNNKNELERFTMRECGECYVFDDERVWHMLTPVAVAEGNSYAYRDIALFDLLPHGWEPA